MCSGHTECDAIIVGNAKISSIPEITANNSDAALIHEAAIGKIAGEQIIKLMTLGSVSYTHLCQRLCKLSGTV